MRKITYREAVREAIREEMVRDETVYMMGEDIGIYGGAFGVSRGLLEEFGPERIRDTPISEAAIVGSAAGSAVTGMRPIAELQFSDFIMIGLDQLVNQAAKMRYMFGGKAKVPMVARTPSGGGTGAAAQHSQSLEAWVAHVPGLKVVQPSTAYDVKGLLKAAIRDDNPVVFYEHKLLYNTSGEVPEEDYIIPLGKADVKREGSDVTVVATAMMVHKALKAAETLAEEGISVEVVDPRTLVPLDEETIVESVKKTGRLVVVHEAVKRGGFGGEIVSVVAESEAFDFLDAPIQRVASLNVPMPFSTILEQQTIPNEEKIMQAVREVIG